MDGRTRDVNHRLRNQGQSKRLMNIFFRRQKCTDLAKSGGKDDAKRMECTGRHDVRHASRHFVQGRHASHVAGVKAHQSGSERVQNMFYKICRRHERLFPSLVRSQLKSSAVSPKAKCLCVHSRTPQQSDGSVGIVENVLWTSIFVRLQSDPRPTIDFVHVYGGSQGRAKADDVHDHVARQ